MAELDKIKYDNLFSGDSYVRSEPVTIAANQKIARGDLLVKLVTESVAVSGSVGTVSRVVAANYVKASVDADEHSFYAIAAEDVTTTTGTAVIAAYRTGAFNEGAVGFGGATANGSRDILAKNGIYLDAVIKEAE